MHRQQYHLSLIKCEVRIPAMTHLFKTRTHNPCSILLQTSSSLMIHGKMKSRPENLSTRNEFFNAVLFIMCIYSQYFWKT
jgi:hypothetical protein